MHAGVAAVLAAVEAVAALDHADAAFRSGTPSLSVAEPALLLFPLARGASGGSIGHAEPLDAHCLRGGLVLGRVEGGIALVTFWRRSPLTARKRMRARRRVRHLMATGVSFHDGSGR